MISVLTGLRRVSIRLKIQLFGYIITMSFGRVTPPGRLGTSGSNRKSLKRSHATPRRSLPRA